MSDEDGQHRALVQMVIRVKKKILEESNVMKVMLAVWSCRKIVVLFSRSSEVVFVHLENATLY